MFLLLILAIFFLANVVFFFEEEHLLIVLVIVLLCLSLSLIKTSLDNLVIINQIETLKLLVKQRLIAQLVYSEIEKVFINTLILTDELTAFICVYVDLIPKIYAEKLSENFQTQVQNATIDLLDFYLKEISEFQAKQELEFM